MVARVLFPVLTCWATRSHPTTGRPSRPSHIRPTALAPTDQPASCLAFRLRLMSITANLSASPVPHRISRLKPHYRPTGCPIMLSCPASAT